VNLYEILQVSKDATPDAIKKAYRKLARKHHPDAGGDAGKFHKITLAYDILMDPKRRARYDETGDISETIPDNSMNKIMSVLNMLFENAVMPLARGYAEPNTTDIVRKMKADLASALVGIKEKQQKLLEARKLMLDIKNRLSARDGENLFLEIINSKLKNIEGEENNLAQEKELTEKCLKLLDGYSYRCDVKEYTPQSMQQQVKQIMMKGFE
jgi:curved DNA-binding protein CbpA